MRVLEWMIDTIESAFGFVAEMLRIALMLVVVLLFMAALLYGLQKAAMLVWGM